MAGEHILIVDDEPAIQSTLRGVLEDEGYRVSAVGTGDDAVALLADETPDLVFLDIWMPGRDGLETLAEMKRLRPGATVVMISGHGTIETAVKATRLGAYDFIEKPLSLEKTLLTATRALDHARLEQENQTLKERLGERSEIIGDMSVKTQAKVLRALEEQAFERVGGRETIKVDVRVIAASNRDLQSLIAAGRFREDLFYRLNVIPIEVPALRVRQDDLPKLVDHFVRVFCAENGKRVKTLSGDALAYLLAYEWPGNVRELRNLVERLVIMSPRDVIGVEDLPPPVRPKEAVAGDARERSLREARDNFERAYILAELRASEWNMTRTAERLGIERSHLYRKLKSYNITPPK